MILLRDIVAVYLFIINHSLAVVDFRPTVPPKFANRGISFVLALSRNCNLQSSSGHTTYSIFQRNSDLPSFEVYPLLYDSILKQLTEALNLMSVAVILIGQLIYINCKYRFFPKCKTHHQNIAICLHCESVR